MEGVWWKRLLDVQTPYRRHLRRLRLGFTLDVGSGIGRNLVNLGKGRAVGVDHDAASVVMARSRGLEAFTPEEFQRSPYAAPGRFDALLFSHVVEHMHMPEAEHLVRAYVAYLRTGGRAVFITPQEAGYRSDSTHVEFMDLASLGRLARAGGLEPLDAYSFPFPRAAGRIFKYNEFVLIAAKR